MSTQLGPTIRAALSDSNKNVRNSAAATFEVLHTKLGIQAIEEIIPHLLDMLDASPEEKSRALDGLKQILATKGRSVLPAVLPKLTEKPVNTTTLSFLASAAGEHLSRYVDTVMDALIGALADNDCDAGNFLISIYSDMTFNGSPRRTGSGPKFCSIKLNGQPCREKFIQINYVFIVRSSK